MSRQYREFCAPHGKVQIVEIADGQCQVGYLASKDSEDWSGKGWQHWGLGQGGYEATCKRFADCSTFNPRKGEA